MVKNRQQITILNPVGHSLAAIVLLYFYKILKVFKGWMISLEMGEIEQW